MAPAMIVRLGPAYGGPIHSPKLRRGQRARPRSLQQHHHLFSIRRANKQPIKGYTLGPKSHAIKTAR